ncbi:MAG TPA: GGDEF domain-containing protein [Polyangia bacterium]|jgi:diguanylate cyclase (GGDEF)-like protein
MTSPLDAFPAHERQVKLASVAPYLAAMFAHLPRPVQVEVELPADPGRLPITARQLLKLALAPGQLELRDARPSADGLPRLWFAADGRAIGFAGMELADDLRTLTLRILTAVFEPADFVQVLEVFALQSANLATLQKIVGHMLRSTDVDEALYAMLSGITSGYGLGFNRAALFIHDEERQQFVGAKAIGPADEHEAHRIWEEIAYEDKTIDRLIEDYSAEHFDSRFQQHVQRLVLRAGPADDDELHVAVAPAPPLIYRRTPPVNPSLAAAGLGQAGELVLAAIAPHGKVLGLVLADNVYSRAPVSPDQLTTFRFFLDQTALVWENLSLLRRVEQLARFDSLTGVFNRREFEARFVDEQSRALRSMATLSLMLIDIDRFKQVNDLEGHAAGDEVLRRLGGILRQTLRTHDVLGRFGGDEFVVLLPNTGRDALALAARRLGQVASQGGISLSIGCASWPGDCADPALLLPTADANLYRAKRAGRRRVCLSEGEPFVIEAP